MKDAWISMMEIAGMTNLSRPTVCAYLESGHIPGFVNNYGCRRVSRATFMAWFNKQQAVNKEITNRVAPTRTEGPRLSKSAFLVYFIECEHGERPIKIGHTTLPNLKVRFEKLQTASPHPLKLRGTIRGGRSVEQKLHRRFKADRLRGEWFRHSENLRKFLKEQGF